MLETLLHLNRVFSYCYFIVECKCWIVIANEWKWNIFHFHSALEVRLQLLQAGSCKLWPKLLSGNLLFLICCRFCLLSFFFCHNNKIAYFGQAGFRNDVFEVQWWNISIFHLMCLKSNRHINNGKYLKSNSEWYIVTFLDIVLYWGTLSLGLFQVP